MASDVSYRLVVTPQALDCLLLPWQVAGFDGPVKPEEAEDGEIDELVKSMSAHVVSYVAYNTSGCNSLLDGIYIWTLRV